MPARKPRRPSRPQSTPSQTAAARVIATIAPAPAYTPPAGFPADPQALLAYLQEGQFTAAQIAYLRSSALTTYVAAVNSTRGMPGMEATTAMGDRIIAAWLAALAALGPAPLASNPFA